LQDWLRAVVTAFAGAFVAGLTAAVKYLYTRLKRQNARQDAIEEGLRGLLYDRIQERYLQCEAKGYADVCDRENMQLLYEPYHALGGNGTGTDLYNKLRELPTAPRQENSQPVNRQKGDST
jgi:hypothetical protein